MPRVLLITAGLAACTILAAPAQAATASDCPEILSSDAPCVWTVPPCVPTTAEPCNA